MHLLLLRVCHGDRFDPRLPSNSYKLDLSRKYDRLVATRLAAISNEERANRATLVDTSQRGNRSNFRNTTLNGVAFTPPTKDAKPTPNPKARQVSKGASGSSAVKRWPDTGIMKTDFISLTTPPADAIPLNGTGFEGLCASLHLEPNEDEGILINRFVHILPDKPSSGTVKKKQRRPSLFGEKKARRREDLWVSKSSRILKSIRRLGRNIETTLTNLRRAISGQYISAMQARELMMSFPSCLSARVNCAVALFCCIVDTGNFHLLFNSTSLCSARARGGGDPSCVHVCMWTSYV